MRDQLKRRRGLYYRSYFVRQNLLTAFSYFRPLLIPAHHSHVYLGLVLGVEPWNFNWYIGLQWSSAGRRSYSFEAFKYSSEGNVFAIKLRLQEISPSIFPSDFLTMFHRFG